MRYYTLEDRVYRSPERDPKNMDIWNPYDHAWEPYMGDPAWIIFNGEPSMTEPALVH